MDPALLDPGLDYSDWLQVAAVWGGNGIKRDHGFGGKSRPKRTSTQISLASEWLPVLPVSS